MPSEWTFTIKVYGYGEDEETAWRDARNSLESADFGDAAYEDCQPLTTKENK